MKTRVPVAQNARNFIVQCSLITLLQVLLQVLQRLRLQPERQFLLQLQQPWAC